MMLGSHCILMTALLHAYHYMAYFHYDREKCMGYISVV
jgi:hypothetical protein